MKVIKIGAMWCSACIIMNNVWQKIQNNALFETVLLDYDFDSSEVEKYSPGEVLPVFIFLDDKNNELGRISGELKYDEMLNYMKGIGFINEEDI